MHQLVMIDDFSFVDPYLLDPITKPDKAPENRPLLLILPGGGYRYLSPAKDSLLPYAPIVKVFTRLYSITQY